MAGRRRADEEILFDVMRRASTKPGKVQRTNFIDLMTEMSMGFWDFWLSIFLTNWGDFGFFLPWPLRAPTTNDDER